VSFHRTLFKVSLFVDRLFSDNATVPSDVKHLYAASILRWYDDFTACLSKNPRNQFQELNKHPFVAKIEQVATVIGLSPDDFKMWQVEVKQGFSSRNLPALTINDYKDLSGPDDIHGVLLDPRCFLESFNAQSNIISSLSTNQVRFQSGLSQVMAVQARLEKKMDRLINYFEEKVIAKPLNGIQDHTIDYDVLMIQHKKDLTPLSLFNLWFKENLTVSYNRLQNKSRSHRNTYIRHKAVIGCILKFANRYPSEKPTTANHLGQWEGDLSNIANDAIIQAMEILKVLRKDSDHDKMFVMTDFVKLGTSPLVVDRAWPLGMPEGAIHLFTKQANGKGKHNK
jgi:hypothetical protein